jgi:hypothetical protein
MSEQTNKDVPGDLDLLRPWFNVVRDARSAGISNGLSILPIVVLVDEHGMPVQWCKVEPTRLSPLSQRDQFELMMKAMAGDKGLPGSKVIPDVIPQEAEAVTAKKGRVRGK